MNDFNPIDPQSVEHLQPLHIDDVPDEDKCSLEDIGFLNHTLTKDGLSLE